MKKCKLCEKKLRSHNESGYCQNCYGLRVYYCIEPSCNKEVSGPNKRCQSHAKILQYSDPKEREKASKRQSGINSSRYKHGNCCRGKIHYCIEKNCHEKVSETNRRCSHHGAILRFSDPKEREKMSELKKGEKNDNWKGGITDLRALIRNLDEYKQWRTKVFQRDNYTCQKCEDNEGSNLEVHHKKQFAIIFDEFLQQYSQFSPLEEKEILVRLAMTYEPFWDVSNGITLCEECHKLKMPSFLLIKKTF